MGDKGVVRVLTESAALCDQGRWTDALETLEAAETPQHAYVLFNIAVLQWRLERYRHAVENFSRTVSLVPQFALAHFHRGCVNAVLENYDEAIADFERCEQCFINSKLIDYTQIGCACKLYLSQVRYNMAACHVETGKLTTAVGVLLKARNDEVTVRLRDAIDSALQRLNNERELTRLSTIRCSLDVFRPKRPAVSRPNIQTVATV